jgi:hypothetical protein
MAIPEWEEIAIPEGYGPYRLLYNPPSETVIAELRSIGEQETIAYTSRTSNRFSQYWMDCKAKPQKMSPMPKAPSQRSGRLSE